MTSQSYINCKAVKEIYVFVELLKTSVQVTERVIIYV